jgi:hypothetical protein
LGGGLVLMLTFNADIIGPTRLSGSPSLAIPESGIGRAKLPTNGGVAVIVSKIKQ